jgi:hypothetical protein
MGRFSNETEELLKASGWFDGRSVPDLVESWRTEVESRGAFALTPAAHRALNEFGGLHIKSEGAGIAWARTDIDINPTFAMFEDDRIFSFHCLQGKQLFPLGEASWGQYFAVIDECGKVYLVMEDVHYVADTFEAALETILLGKETRVLE